ncbi:alpha/beta hydrolase [Prevotella copri]|jgi:acetyl esterase/lipase|uniref:Alpha/beta hydrolase n=1 Tax=Segatella copri TaxID=165179 RepID=A0AAW4YM90_9BACT|nr:alpha/beta hydrolase [Segatella copri]MCE4122805.1 alpha/beta hydrolase [Segatella copri]MCP9497700.1 alpha/beta hydrolase [Segatella copri]MCP9513924.1 alpha/beta hydrolase [Segatella copri]MCP9523067.1 alpha/beta hydrolase [Segatella copri]
MKCKRTKQLLLFTIIGTLFCTSIQAQNRIDMPVWGAEKPQVSDNSQNATMSVYLPKEPNGMAVIMCPGGGYDHHAITHEGHDMASWFNGQGITYVVLKYRLPRCNDTIPLSDAKRAIKVVRMNAEKWKVNPHMVGIMGGSAGGHLASSLATMYGEAIYRPDFQVLLYPVISMDPKITNKGTHNQLIGEKPAAGMEERYTTSNRVDRNTPQAFIALSADDTGVLPINSLLYYEALRKNRVSATLHIYPTGGHGWGFKDSFIYKSEWTMELAKWLKIQREALSASK